MQVPRSRLASRGGKSQVYLWSLPTSHDNPASKKFCRVETLEADVMHALSRPRAAPIDEGCLLKKSAVPRPKQKRPKMYPLFSFAEPRNQDPTVHSEPLMTNWPR